MCAALTASIDFEFFLAQLSTAFLYSISEVEFATDSEFNFGRSKVARLASITPIIGALGGLPCNAKATQQLHEFLGMVGTAAYKLFILCS